jgi:energy-coupling factor transporter transmembrane protein EcfT
VLAAVVLFPLLGPERRRQLQVWRGLLRPLLLVSLLLLPVLTGLFFAEKDLSVLGIPLSSAGLLTGAWMDLRITILLLVGASFSAQVSVPALARILESVGMRGLGFSLGIAVNAVPMALRTIGDTWQALRLRGGLRRARWRGLRLFLVAITVRVAYRGEEVLQAVHLRAFDPTRRKPAVQIRRADLLLLSGLILLTVAIALI